jgi:hypothetical protein
MINDYYLQLTWKYASNYLVSDSLQYILGFVQGASKNMEIFPSILRLYDIFLHYYM